MQMRQSFILRRDLEKEYLSIFNRYAIDIIYGDNLLIGDEIEEEYRNSKGE